MVCRIYGFSGHIWMLRLVSLFVYFRRFWNLREKMFGFHFRLHLSPRARIYVVSRLQKAHKYASLQKISDVPPTKVQSLLYPFSELHPYLDRYWTLYYYIILFHVNYWLESERFSGLLTWRSSSSFTPVWRTWLKRRSCSTLLRLTRLIITPLQWGWTTFLHWTSRRSARLLCHFKLALESG